MRTAFGVSVGLVLAASLFSSGCVVKSADDDGGGGTSTGTTVDDGCNGVPVEGECVDDKTIRGCLVSEEFDTPARVIMATCGPEEQCQIGVNGAQCGLIGLCYNGESRCQDAGTLQNCVDGDWVDEACGGDSCISQPGLGAQCLSQAAGTGITISGTLEYEYLTRNASLTDFDTTALTEKGVDFFVTVYDVSPGEEELLGMGLTGAGIQLQPGEFQVELSRQPDNDNETIIYFWPMLFDQQGQPRMAMARAENGDAIHQYSTEYWWWGFEVCTAGDCTAQTMDVGTMLIDQESGSGAANIYRWMDYGLFSFEELFPETENLSFAIFWNAGNDYDCGNCFISPIGGGADVLYDIDNNFNDHYDTAINISGSGESPTMWAKSVIGHEFGHWAMQSYTKSPAEGGPHYVNAASRAGLSYSEGFATFTGQRNISNSPSDNEPIYFTKKGGTTFWVDISDNTWSGGDLELPNANGPLDQDINENVVASMFWSFWATQGAVTPLGKGDQPVYDTIRSERLLSNDTFNRGYPKVDMLDYLDAMTCEGTGSASDVEAVASDVNYPWDGNPTCP